MNKIRGFLKKEVIFIIFMFIFSSLLSADVKTGANVPNSGPALFKIIPNFSIPINQNFTNAFDLDDYFVDGNGDNLSYWSSNILNINISIDSSNLVSFYPDYNFSGNKTVTFYSTDGTNNASSNLVSLEVGTDDEAPQWRSPSRSKVNVYQNDYVNFTTLWTDNRGLSGYIFSINQGSGYLNYSAESFTGVSNLSSYRVQISASSGTIVYWLFCANDTNNNLNCTTPQAINISETPVAPGPSPGGTTGEGTTVGYILDLIGGARRELKNFTVEPESFKVSLKQGSTETRILKVSNIGNSDLLFALKAIQDYSGYISINIARYGLNLYPAFPLEILALWQVF